MCSPSANYLAEDAYRPPPWPCLVLQAKPSLSIESSVLVQALWGNYLDASTPSPVARTNWIAGAWALLST